MGAQKKAHGAYHHGNLSESLIEAALELVSEGGVAKLSLRAVARRSGVSPAAPYRHFSSREALMAAVATRGYQMRTKAMREALAGCEGDAMSRLCETGIAYVLFAHNHPAHYAIMTSPALVDTKSYPELAAAGAESMGMLLSAVTEAQAAGALQAGDVQELAAAAWASVHGLATLLSGGQLKYLGFDPSDVDGAARRVTRAMIDAMRQAHVPS